MIKIESHPRGISISLTGSISRAPFFEDLEHRIGTDVMLIRVGNLILPLSSAADVLDICSSEEFAWDKNLLKLAHNQSEHRHQQLMARVEVAQALESPVVALAGYDEISRLDAHQIEAVAAICVPSLRGLALFDEQGTGKTITALAAFDRLHQLKKVERLLVIAPKSVLGAWSSDCEKFLGSKYAYVTVEGQPSNRHDFIQRGHDIFFIGYESAVRDQGLLRMVVAAKQQSYMLVIDESYFVKNPETARAHVVAEIRPYCERALVLCGTPAPNSAVDIVNQINIADGGVAFSRIAIPRNDQAAEHVIRNALDDAIYLRRLKEDVLPDLPEKAFERVFIELQPIQRKIYDKVHADLVLRVRSIDDQEFARQLSSFIAARVALLQLCSHPRGLDSLYTEAPAKLLALDILIDELVVQQAKKVIIWSFFRHSLQTIADRYMHYGLVRIDGSVAKVEDRVDAIERFQNDPSVRIFLGNAAAAGTGITLTAAHHAIYESFSNQAAHYMQSIDRIHRRGQTQSVTYHVLLSTNTIEEREFERLVHKERASRDLLGDRYEEPITRERFLRELGELHGTQI
jgi:SNF2 family DNA or RNA helicase